MFKADEQRQLLLAFWRGAEELGLIRSFGDVEATGNAEGLEVRKGRVTKLVDDDLGRESTPDFDARGGAREDIPSPGLSQNPSWPRISA